MNKHLAYPGPPAVLERCQGYELQAHWRRAGVYQPSTISLYLAVVVTGIGFPLSTSQQHTQYPFNKQITCPPECHWYVVHEGLQQRVEPLNLIRLHKEYCRGPGQEILQPQRCTVALHIHHILVLRHLQSSQVVLQVGNRSLLSGG